MMISQSEKANDFKALHDQEDTFVIPNPWDVGSARLFEALGFKALATTSSGFAYSLGKVDGQVSLEEKLTHCHTLAKAISIPISADLENGFADSPEGVANTIKLAAETGIVGGSIEDYSGKGIYDFDLAVERIQAAVEAVKALDFPFCLTARAENLLRSVNDMDDTLKRLQAFEEVGADVLYAPGLKSLEEVKVVCNSVTKPVNVLITFLPNNTVAELKEAGAKRISIGGAMAQVAYEALLKGGNEMLAGKFSWLERRESGKDIASLLSLK